MSKVKVGLTPPGQVPPEQTSPSSMYRLTEAAFKGVSEVLREFGHRIRLSI